MPELSVLSGSDLFQASPFPIQPIQPVPHLSVADTDGDELPVDGVSADYGLAYVGGVVTGLPVARPRTDGLGADPMGGDALGDDAADPMSWHERALCAETDPEAFFPEKGGSTREAKRVCLSCDVRVECLEFALGNDERFGIWGGLSERERRRLKRQAV
jgi:WhiB family redox-sensing transcriptional regulator